MTILMHESTTIRADSDPRFFVAKATPGDCALFTLPQVVINGKSIVTDERAIVNIPFRAKLLSGYTGKYAIRIGNAVTGVMTISHAESRKEMSREYSDYDQMNKGIHACVPSETVAGSDYTVLTIRPDNNWLEPGQRFHVFRIAMGGYQRYADNENHLPSHNSTDILFGIQRPH
jgi:hypothetical protein